MSVEDLSSLTTTKVLLMLKEELGVEPKTTHELREVLSLRKEVALDLELQNFYSELLRGLGRITGVQVTNTEEAADALLRIEEFTSRIQGLVCGLAEVSDSLRAVIQNGETSNEAIGSVLSLLERLQSAASDMRQTAQHQESA